MVNVTMSREHNNGGLVDGASLYRTRYASLQYTTLAALEANDGLDVIALYEWYGENTTCDYYDWGTSALDMNCGPRHSTPGYDPNLLGVLGAIPHLSPAAYEIDRIDNTVGYCLRNMLRCCFKHNCFIHQLEHSFGGTRLSTGELQAQARRLLA
jgi:hypothetical protein